MLLQCSTRVEFSEIPLPLLVLIALFRSAADHSTTDLCLRQPVPGWQVEEVRFAVANNLRAIEALSLSPLRRV